MLYAREFALVEARQVFFARCKVEIYFFGDRDGSFSFLRGWRRHGWWLVGERDYVCWAN